MTVASPSNRSVGIGILGAGNVGGALALKLIKERDSITRKSGIDLHVVAVGVRDLAKARVVPTDLLMTAEAVVAHPDVDVVVELIGGVEPAGALVRAALESGKSVVTGNKALLAEAGFDLISTAEANNVSLLFEAAVAGGIPIIRPLSQGLAGEKITRVMGIVNGTTNFILSEMADRGASYSDVLAEAQAAGFAEADPTADVSGADAGAKAAILASLAFGTWVAADHVEIEGIESVTREQIGVAAALGYSVKLLAVCDDTPDGISVQVNPTLVPIDHPLSTVRGPQNAVFLEGPFIGELMFSGPGAGGDATATAALGDVIDAARGRLAGGAVSHPVRFNPTRMLPKSQLRSARYYRMDVSDQPGVLAEVSTVFAQEGVSISQVYQEGRGDEAELIIITHEASAREHEAAVDQLRASDGVLAVDAGLTVLEA